MTSKGKFYWAKVAVVMAAIPLVIWAYETGPDAGVCGVPGELGTCTSQAGCHVGTTNDPNNKGSVSVAFPNGLTYAPGVVQQLMVTIADPLPTQVAWGFQLTARTSNPGTQAGSFASTDVYTGVECAQVGNVSNESPVLTRPSTETCPANMGLQYIEHNDAGYLHTMGPGSGTYTFNWTPPATNVGTITIYLAGNAGHGGAPTVEGDHIYATTYTLTPTSAIAPAVTQGSVANGASYLAGVVPNSWMQLLGSNLASVTDTWQYAVGANGALPQSLDGVSVSVGGQPAYIYYVSPTQINVLAPNVGVGPLPVTVTTPGGSSTATATSSQYGPAFFTYPENQAVATRLDGSLVAANGTFPGFPTVAAKPGDVIILWGTGFGPTTPSIPVGFATPSSQFLTGPVTVTLGSTSVPVSQGVAFLSPGSAGLYQLVITVPSNMANGNYPIVATINGVSSPSTETLTVQQ